MGRKRNMPQTKDREKLKKVLVIFAVVFVMWLFGHLKLSPLF